MNLENILETKESYEKVHSLIKDKLFSILEKGVITQEDNDQLGLYIEKNTENYNKFIDVGNEYKKRETDKRIEKIEANKIDNNIDSIIEILTNGGKNTSFYKDSDGNILMNGDYMPKLNTVKVTVDEQSKLIETLISQGTVDIDGNKVALNIAYSKLKQTVEGIDLSVAKLNQNISENYSTTQQVKSTINQKADEIIQSISGSYVTKSEVKEVVDKQSELEQNLDGFQQTVSKTYMTIDSFDGEKTTINKTISSVKQTADKINWLIKSGTSQSDMVLTDKLFSIITNKVIVEAKKIELNGSIDINNGTFKVQTNGNLKIGGLTGRLNGDGTTQGIFEVTSTGKVYSRNPNSANIYTLFDDGILEVRNENIKVKINTDGIQIKDISTGGELTLSEKEIKVESLAVTGKIISNGGISSNSYLRGHSLAINNKKFYSDTKTINGSSQSALYLGHTLILYGRASFTELTANSTKTVAVNFNQEFTNPPVVMAIANSSSPNQCRVGTGSVTTTGCNLYLNRTSATDTNVFWIAIGERAASDNFTT